MASRKKQLIPVLMLSLMLFFLVVTTQAQAAPIKETWRSTWQVAADFIGDQPNVTLIVSVEHLNSGGVWTAYSTESVLLACVTAGGVSFTNDTAVFDGTGSIQCAMPSLQEIVYDMTNGRYTPQTSCNCKGNPTILADVQLTPNTTGSDWENPLVHRALGTSTDMALAATVPAYSTIPQAFMQLNVVGNLAQSNPFIANHMPNSLAASYVKVIAGMQPAFLANGADPGTGTPPASGLAVSNAATTLTIGYSPVSGQSLHGVLHSLNVDPGCYGTG